MYLVKNASGQVQLNPDLFTMVMTSKGSVTSVRENIWGNISSRAMFTITLSGTKHYSIAIRGAVAGKVGMVRRQVSGSNVVYTYISDAPIGSVFYYYVFEQVTTLLPAVGGLTLRNPSNQVTFSSDAKWLLAMQKVTHNDVVFFGEDRPEPGPGVPTYTNAAANLVFEYPGRTMAFMQFCMSMYYAVNGDRWYGDWDTETTYQWSETHGILGASCVGSNVTLGGIHVRTIAQSRYGTADDTLAEAENGTFLVGLEGFLVDVTHCD